MKRALLVGIALLGACKSKSTDEIVSKLDPTRLAGTAPVVKSEPVKRGTEARKAATIYGVIPRTCSTEQATAKAKKAIGTSEGVKIDPEAVDQLGWDPGGDHKMIQMHIGPADAAEIDKVKTGVRMATIDQPVLNAALAKAALDTATACKGWIISTTTDQIFDVENAAHYLPLGIPDARKLLILHLVEGGDSLNFIDTMGMKQMGLPELSLRNVPTTSMNQAGSLVNAAAQAMIDGNGVTRDGQLEVDASLLAGDWHLDDLKKSGGTGKVTWSVVWQTVDEDGAKLDEPEIELIPPGGNGTDAVGLMAALDTYFGATEDHAVNLDEMRDDLQKAGVHARAELTKLLPHFSSGIPFKEQLSVKAPFKTDSGGTEWMWVDVLKISKRTIDGTLNNDPDQVSALKSGAKVSVKFDEIADFIYRKEGEKSVGGFSLEVMKAHGMDVPALD
ncbi:MAG TPA: DUF2314 domain-containing protein [Kofleriaceae bacterium]